MIDDGKYSNRLHARFLRGLTMSPDRVALRTGNTEMTYSELHEHALREAGSLLAATGSLTRVGILADRTPVAYIGFLAGLYAGATVVPLNVNDPGPRLANLVLAAGIDAIIADRRGAALLPEVYEESGILPTSLVDGDASAPPGVTGVERTEALRLEAPLPGTDTAYILFTSGSTGAPKGVPISHANVDHFLSCAEKRYDFPPGEVFSQTFDHTFDLSVFDMFMAWGSAGTLVTVPRYGLGRLSSIVRRHGITVWFSVPSSIMAARRYGGLAPNSMPSLRWSLFCGEALRGEDATHWSAAAPNSTVDNLYGPTEVTIACTAHRVAPAATPEPLVNGIVPIGRLFEGLRAVLLAEDGAGSTSEGELCISGPQVFAGYLDPADSVGRFVDLGGHRYYRTGDLVRSIPQGFAFVGRLDQQVKVHGYRVELPAIEWWLTRCAGVVEAAVVATIIEGETVLAGFYTGAPSVENEALRHLRMNLPDYSVPRSIWHVDALPQNRSGKTDRRSLALLAAERLAAEAEGGGC